jgi:DNA-binding response OmpR family regulator
MIDEHVSPWKILVADDDSDMRELLTHILRRKNYEVISVATADEAQQHAVSAPPDLIVMDIGMPDMDGLTAIWALRETKTLAEIPIVILSAFDSYDLRAEAASAGCQAYLTKPFEVSEFLSVIERALKPGDQLP